MSNPVTFEDAVRRVAEDCAALLISKHRDYGPGNILAFGELGVLIRAHDKVQRLRNLLWERREPQHESVDDTWMDLANYALIALMLRRGWFELPLGGDGGGEGDRGRPAG